MKLFPFLYSMVASFAILVVAYAIMTASHVQGRRVRRLGLWHAQSLLALRDHHRPVEHPLQGPRPSSPTPSPLASAGLPVDERQVAYVRKLAKNSLRIAIGLHVVSAIVLFVLALTGSAASVYVASALALLLTVLRPAAKAYEYLAARLRSIGDNWRYPREDVLELRTRVESMEAGVRQTQSEFDADRPESLVANQTRLADDTRRDLARLTAELEALRAANDRRARTPRPRGAVRHLPAQHRRPVPRPRAGNPPVLQVGVGPPFPLSASLATL